MELFGMEELVESPDRPSLLFEEGSYTLPELLESHLLPVVVQFDPSGQPLPFNEFNFDLTQPLLLYKKRNIQKVAAKSLHISDNRYEEAGESLLIPEDYKGWFSVLPRIAELSTVNADKVPHFSTVEELANSNSERFLIGGTKSMTGIQVNETSGCKLEHTEIQIAPGEVLIRDKIYYGETKKKSRLFRKPKYIIEKFLKCRDEMDKEILLPFEQHGIYYQISHKGGKAYNNVLQMSDVVARKMAPRLIKLVYGRFPVTQRSFTGLMKAESSDIETSVIACTLVNTKNVLLEIPVTTLMHFRIALTNDTLRLNTCYRNAISLCAERANTYMRNIKVCVNVPNEVELDNEDFITKRNRSNSFDIDAIHASPWKTKENPMKKAYGSLKKPTGHKSFESNMKVTRDLRLSESLSSEVSLRPVRSLSSGHMSFCVGNNFLTVSLLDGSPQVKRDSGNNNSIHQFPNATKAGSRHVFNDRFPEEDTDMAPVDCGTRSNDSELGDVTDNGDDPLTLSHFPNISAYVNMIDPPNGSLEQSIHDYIPVSSHRTPNSSAPVSAPPPLPLTCYTRGGASSGASSSSHDENALKNGSRDAFEYAVPKRGEPNKRQEKQDTANPEVLVPKDRQPVGRRPSTFTFTEGCLQSIKAKRFNCMPSPEIGEIDTEEDCPVYENIKTLMEAVSVKEELLDSSTSVLDLDCVTGVAENAENLNEPAGSDASTPTGDISEEKRAVCIERKSSLPDIHVVCEPPTVQQGIEEDKDEQLTFESINFCLDNQDHDTETQVKKIGPVLTKVDCGTGEKERVAMETIDEADGYFIEEHETSFSTKDTESVTYTTDQNRIQANGIVRLSGLTKTTGGESRPPYQVHDEDIRLMSTDTIVEQLKLVGIKETTLKTMAELEVDGKILVDVLNGDTPISECLVGINLVDQQKISMFIRGWRPDMDYI